MRQMKLLMVGIVIFMGLYFSWIAMTIPANEGDSVIYHIPIAQSLIEGKWGINTSPFTYYPGTAEMLLVPMLMSKVPLNFFNVAAWIALILSIRVMANKWGLEKNVAWVVAISLGMVPATIRLLPTQTVDLWMTIWWVWSLIWIKNKNWKGVGLAWGLLMGTKFSGIWLVGLEALTLGWWNIKTMLLAGLIGGGWYVRNWIMAGNPFYPLDIGPWKGDAPSQLPIVWKTLVNDTKTIKILGQAWVSEWLGWGGVIITFVWRRNRWVTLGLTNILLFLVMPGGEGTLLSNLRYLLGGIVLLGIELTKYLQDRGKQEWIGVMTAINAVMVLPQLEYRPKLVILVIVVWGGWMWRQNGLKK